MHPQVYRILTLLTNLVADLPMGTNLALLHLLWMLISGRLLHTRGAVIPGLSALGLPDAAVRRAWAALGGGAWSGAQLLQQWGRIEVAEGQWQPHQHEGKPLRRSPEGSAERCAGCTGTAGRWSNCRWRSSR